MRSRKKSHSVFGLEHMLHRAPLSPRFWVYSSAAYLMPVVTQIFLPHDPGMYDELVWLVTLAPAFLLSLHYGLNGALLGLLMGTALFVTVQFSLAINFTPDDWRITVPIYVAYGTLAISVGWLSQQLHDYYRKQLEGERLVGIGQVTVTIRHHLNNALQQVMAESQLLADAEDLDYAHRESVQSIREGAQRIAADVEKLTNLASAPVTPYVDGVNMLDLESARAHA